MRSISYLFVIGILAAALGLVAAQAPPPVAPPPPAGKADAPPVLAEVDRLRIVNAAQAVELWSLKLQAAAVEVQRARADLDKLVAAAAVPGWQLTDKLEYVKAPPKGDK